MNYSRREVLALAAASAVSAAAGRPRVGCQTRAYGAPIAEKARLLTVLEDIKAAGYEVFETNYRSLEHSFDDPGPMRREIEARGLPLIGLHVGVGLFDPRVIEDERELLLRAGRGTAALGGSLLVVSGRELPHGPNGRPLPTAAAVKAREAERLGAKLRGMGVRLCIHNHSHEVQHDAEELRMFLGQTSPENVSLLFDVGHIHRGEVDPAAFLREYAARIAGLHLRDVKGGEEVEMGSGVIDFAALGRAVGETAWTGWLIVEVNERMNSDAQGSLGPRLVRQAREHVRRTMGC